MQCEKGIAGSIKVEGVQPFTFVIVDDNECERFLLKEIIRDLFGASGQCLCFEDGSTFLHWAISSSMPHFIILDHKMPGLSGEEIIQSLRATKPTWLSRIILFSNIFPPSFVKSEKQAELGIMAIHLRPVDFADYAQLLSGIIQRIPHAWDTERIILEENMCC